MIQSKWMRKPVGFVLFFCLTMGCTILTGRGAAQVPSTQVPLTAASAPTALPSVSPAVQLPTIPAASPVPTKPAAPASLNAHGPYILFKGQGGIWITNPDGGFATRISAYDVQGDLRHAISPAGDKMALVVSTEQGLDLVLVTIPSGETETITHLIRISPEEKANAVSAKSFVLYAIRDYDSVAWQPGRGDLLAFIGAMKGPSADLYLYDTHSKEIKQLTNGPSQAVLPAWSPDGKYILHFGVSWVQPLGGAIGNANQLDGAWSVQVSDGKVITLPKPVSTYPTFVGWQDASHFLIYDVDETCSRNTLRSVDVPSGKSAALMKKSFYTGIALSPQNGALLFSGNDAAGCPNALGDGVYLLLPGQTTPTKLLDKIAYEGRWLPESGVFLAYPEALISADGSTRYEPPVYEASYNPAVSTKGYQAWEVIQNQQGRAMVRIPGGEWQKVMDGMVKQLIWDSATGETLLIALEDGSLYAASFPDFTPRLVGNLGGVVDQAIWLP